MYALTARELYQASTLEAKVKVLVDFQKNKLQAKRPEYAEFEPSFMRLAYSSQVSKLKPLVRYILMKIYHKNSTGITMDAEQVTIEHLAAETAKKMALWRSK